MAGSVFGIANGVIRELVYKDRVGELRANQIAVAVLIASEPASTGQPAGTFR